ncbi:MAG: protein-L-isoaspartate(D-aspartate) O-methyltransferase [Elusimicrobia bacterium]|nr:protein-L-isoaspartate(D-aspartate) O-methyltransferase [Elusimicrobiota bacterium]MBD3411628.1 protein-L-isoaspartate(D-aspartate) O-methyltransferase [Elusimicrobiota bacterium]
MFAICLVAGMMSVIGCTHKYAEQRMAMIKNQLIRRGISDSKVLDAMSTVPRHRFIPENQRLRAYDDGPVPIGRGQTISQPYIVALMSELMELSNDDRVLEIGTGSGYQAAILAEIVKQVYTIEIIPELGNRARDVLAELSYENVEVRIGDGYFGWPEHAPFDAIMVTAAPEDVPEALIKQLAVGGRLVIPVGSYPQQDLKKIVKTKDGVVETNVIPVLFVPMTGEIQKK